MRKKRPSPSPQSLANLRMWQKGESGNPHGRPARYSIRAALLALLESEAEKKGTTRAQACAEMLMEAIDGKKTFTGYQLEALKFVVEQVDGKSKQTVVNEGVSTLVQVASLTDAQLRERRKELAKELKSTPALPEGSVPEVVPDAEVVPASDAMPVLLDRTPVASSDPQPQESPVPTTVIEEVV